MTLAQAFDPRRNSLNTLRLVLAAMVLVSHAWPLLGRPEPTIGSTTLGTVAVYGFFVISGYLIASSRMRLGGGRYLWHRFLRIFPGFWACLLVTALVFAPLEFRHTHGGIGGFHWSSAASYVGANAGLAMKYWNIDGTLTNNPFPGAWDGSLWSLIYEFICYLAVLAAGTLGLLRRPRAALAVAAAILAVDLLPGRDLHRLRLTWVLNGFDFFNLAAMFCVGVVLFLFAHRVPMRRSLGMGALVVSVALLLGLGHPSALLAIPLGYLMLWLGVMLPFHGLFRRNDISYGVYIYAFVVQQLLAPTAAARHGIGLYILATAAITALLGALSWFAIEQPALRLKNVRGGRRAVPSAAAVAAAPAGTRVAAVADPSVEPL